MKSIKRSKRHTRRRHSKSSFRFFNFVISDRKLRSQTDKTRTRIVRISSVIRPESKKIILENKKKKTRTDQIVQITGISMLISLLQYSEAGVQTAVTVSAVAAGGTQFFARFVFVILTSNRKMCYFHPVRLIQ